MNIKVVYQFNLPLQLKWRDSETLKFRVVDLDPIKKIYVDNILYKKSNLELTLYLDVFGCCKKMDKYLLKLESPFIKQEFNVIEYYNKYRSITKYSNRRFTLKDYTRLDNLVALELECEEL